MQMECLFVSGRSACLALRDGGLYHTRKPYRLLLNGKEYGHTDRVITSLYGLWPDTEYVLEAYDGDQPAVRCTFHTEHESVSLDVRRFGAVGDGVHDDTPAVQAAIACCPPAGRAGRGGGGATCLMDRLMRLAWSMPMTLTLTSCPSFRCSETSFT